MKKLFAILAVMGVLSFGMTQTAMAQDSTATAAPEQTEQVAPAATEEVATATVEEGSMHKELKTKFIEGDAGFMSLVAIALVLGLAFCIERIIYLSLAEVDVKKLMAKVEAALEKGDVEGVSLEQAEEAIWKELEKMKTVPVSEQELEKVKNRYESEQIFNNINYLNVATNLAFFELTGKAEDINEEVGKYRAVTAEQIQATSARCFVPENCSILYYKAIS